MKYQLVLGGELIEGFDLDEAVSNLVQLLKLPEDQVRMMFQGDKHRIRKLLDRDKAEHLRQKVMERGMSCVIEPVAEAAAALPEEQSADMHDAISATQINGQRSADPSSRVNSADGDLPRVLSLDLDDDSAPLMQAAASGGLELVPLEDASEDDEVEPPESDESQEIVLETMVQSTPVVKIDMHQEEEDEPSPPDADSELNKGTFFEQPSIVKPERPKKRSGVNLPLIALGSLFVIGGLVWLLLPMLNGGDELPILQAPPENAQPAPPADPQMAASIERIEALFRSVRVWMIQFGSGFDPQQVTLERLSQDLGLSPAQMTDGWGSPFRYIAKDAEYAVISAGPDSRFETPDDLERRGTALQQ